MVTVGHAGGLPGYGSQYRFAPDHGVGVIAFTNLRYGPVYNPTSKALALLIEKARLPARAVLPSPMLLTRQQQVAQLVQSWDEQLGAAIVAENFFMDRSRAGLDRACAREAGADRRDPFDRADQGREPAARQLPHRAAKAARRDVSFTLTPEREPKVQEINIMKH